MVTSFAPPFPWKDDKDDAGDDNDTTDKGPMKLGGAAEALKSKKAKSLQASSDTLGTLALKTPKDCVHLVK